MRTEKNQIGSCIICVRHGLATAGTSAIILCGKCAHPKEIRTFCAKCKRRLRLSLDEAIALYVNTKSGVPIERTGIAILYELGCPSCMKNAPSPRLYYINTSLSSSCAVIT